ncbi:hypothetical protein HT585_14000 [Ensifer sp. HO-A22]|uniref:Uncharacterized protein n=1 Tax=Ensifer oleiphilus TaxID=2742698 RepID=A0A7Y6UN72_9HYPH|nr:hypothetical protein [Ensifer oleiphilus]NVD39975.1 hypothetical protein [Ensifer oleiphilus]
MRIKSFLETTFGPGDIQTVETVLDEWRKRQSLPRDHPDTALAAAILLSLFRAGHDTVPKLQLAASRHKGLIDLVSVYEPTRAGKWPRTKTSQTK